MSIFKIKLRTTDRLWTKYKRIKEDYTCQKCGRVYPPDNCRNLGVAHFHGRAHENVRFDEENTLCLCNIPCHQYLDTHKTEFKEFMRKRLGDKAYDLLDLRAHITKKRDDKSDALIIRQMLKEQEV
jgi:hypothetical protein